MTKPAEEIDVEVFHHTLVWPLRMHGPKGVDPIPQFLNAFKKAGWVEPTESGTKVDSDYSYEEVVYLHPFVRDFLFGDGKAAAKSRTTRRFVMRHLTGATVEVDTGYDPALGKPARTTFALKVEQAELLLIRPRIAMLVVELSYGALRDPAESDAAGRSGPSPGPRHTLAEVLYLQNQLRRAFPPYFDGEKHGESPLSVRWQGLASPTAQSTTSPSSEFKQFVETGAEPPMYAHWRAFWGNEIAPLKSAVDRESGGLFLQQLVDDRIPALSFLVVKDATVIDQHDLDRLPAFDVPGLSYDSEFREGLRNQFQYTRFRHWGTTYFCNGTSFAMLTESGSFTNKLLNHYQRHYTNLAIIAQYQHAALLYFADELADIAKDLAIRKKEPTLNVRDEFRTLQHRFLKFRTRSYFTEVSNQIQGKDLFNIWFERLGTRALFERLSQTSNEIYQAIENHEVRELTLAQTNLSKIAYYGLGISIALSILSALLAWATLFPDTVQQRPAWNGRAIPGPWIWLLTAIAVASLVVGGLHCLFRKSLRGVLESRERR